MAGRRDTFARAFPFAARDICDGGVWGGDLWCDDAGLLGRPISSEFAAGLARCTVDAGVASLLAIIGGWYAQRGSMAMAK